MRPEAVEEARLWIERAAADLRTTEILLDADDAPLDIAAFHLQQATEKLIKSVLTALGIHFPKTHDLNALVRLAPTEARLDPEQDLWSELSYFAVLVRYPGDRPDLGAVQIRIWRARVIELREHVENMIGSRA